ncbi:D-alanine--poly(phosphoribitol) ligase subunit DltA [Staphylococcus sp. SQ8-PEA]|uniref:D-alanine--D-alanyl carrier protein ligase n=1 Tax=Staphylococcus marylandisciuri TaxID=2981529 RepID=A0ABT2QSU0_9STAP|nr:D-alanine--poly(phosphoribitol) ligase subunit DltA [Staphylococcus marylandisciuri]MCU5747037.1 D-alanine--poly(phosphoribitol) ligase subunit DltA [Staphylococcus marylandisciuri]
MKDILQMLKQHSESRGETHAVQHEDETMTYGELETSSSLLAHMIRHTTKPIILYGHMSPYMIAGMFGALKAGCGYVPIDTSIPEQRVQTIIKKVDPDVIFNTSSEELAVEGVTILNIEDLKATNTYKEQEPQIQDDSIAYTIFTSGSTGEPKGVQIYYDSLVEFANWVVELNDNQLGQHWLNQAPLSFDLSVMAIYPSILSGGTLQLVDKKMINKPMLLHELFAREPIHVWVSTPSFMELCLMLPEFDAGSQPSMGTFLFCGEILGHKTASMLLKKFPNAKVYNTYGPTEATVAVTSIQVTEALLSKEKVIPVGAPRKGTSLSLTDDNELVITGNSVSAGYLKDPERTEKVFFDNEGQRAYYSGDSAQYREGQWYIQGRVDNQIKYNGYRMELEEIEAKLKQLDHVREAIVVPVYRRGKVAHLLGVTMTTHQIEDEAQTTHDMKAELKHILPEYMIPKKFVFVDQLPLTHNGKLDRKKINEVYGS